MQNIFQKLLPICLDEGQRVSNDAMIPGVLMFKDQFRVELFH